MGRGEKISVHGALFKGPRVEGQEGEAMGRGGRKVLRGGEVYKYKGYRWKQESLFLARFKKKIGKRGEKGKKRTPAGRGSLPAGAVRVGG